MFKKVSTLKLCPPKSYKINCKWTPTRSWLCRKKIRTLHTRTEKHNPCFYPISMVDEAKGKWELCRQYIQSNLPEQAFGTWFASIEFVSLEADKLTLSVPTKFVYEYIEEHYLPLMQKAISLYFGDSMQLLYRLRNSEQKENAPVKKEEAPAVVSPQRTELPPLDSQLNPCYTFENFVEGVSNKLARTVGISIAENPGQATFNPFFLYGPSGVGKTHLANAIGIRLRELYPEKRVLFVSAHIFQTQYTESVRQNKFNDFLHFYQTIDVLIVDDVQELTTAKTQQTFFHIFNHLQQNRKQLVMTCDRPPVLFEGIEERMLTRFKWGMIAELEKPDTALRKAILESKIRRDGLSIPKDVIKYIASNVESSVRELEGIVNSIMAYSIVDNCNINIALAERIVARAVNLEKREVTADDIIQAVAQRFGLKQKDLLSKSRKQNLVQARQLAMYLVHKYTGISYVQIGRRFGGRDHTTVLHACNQVSLRISMEKDFRHEVETLELALKK